MATPQQIPRKSSFKSSEVCQYTDTQPYVLRFWESEFPQLRPERPRGGQAVYSRRDVELVLRIKQLLHEEEITLADARERLEREVASSRAASRSASRPRAGQAGRGDLERTEPNEAASAAADSSPDPQFREVVPPPERPSASRRAERSAADPIAAVAPHARETTVERPRPAAGNGREGQAGFGSVSRERYEDAVDEIAHLRLQLKEAETVARRAEHGAQTAEEQLELERERTALAIQRLEQLLEIVS